MLIPVFIAAVIMALPLLWMLLTSLKGNEEIVSGIPSLLPLYIDEYPVDISGWHLDLSVTFGFRGYIVHYHYRNPFWITTLQVGIFGIIAFWERHCNSVRVVGREYAYN